VQSSETPDTKPSASEASAEASTVESAAEVSVDTEEDFALSMADIAKQSGLDLNKVIQALMMLA
jgi:hypothetical protein